MAGYAPQGSGGGGVTSVDIDGENSQFGFLQAVEAGTPTNVLGSGGSQVVISSPCVLTGITIVTASTGVITLYDNASAASGRIICKIPTAATQGKFHIPAQLITNGVYASFAVSDGEFTLVIIPEV